jgi:hypothetical protein
MGQSPQEISDCFITFIGIFSKQGCTDISSFSLSVTVVIVALPDESVSSLLASLILSSSPRFHVGIEIINPPSPRTDDRKVICNTPFELDSCIMILLDRVLWDMGCVRDCIIIIV